MDLKDSPAEAEFRAKARALARKTRCPASGARAARLEDKLDYWRAWQRLLYDAGYAGLSWPKEYGGGGADAKLRAVFTEELDRAGAPERLNIIGEDFAGPTIIALRHRRTSKQRYLAADPDRRRDLVPAVLRAGGRAPTWPRCARRPPRWTAAGASRARRSGPAGPSSRPTRSCSPAPAADPRHRGITYFLLPMDSPGRRRPAACSTCWARPSSTRSSSTTCSSPTTAWSARSTAAGRSRWARSAFERVAIATGRVNTTGAVDDLIAEIACRTTDDGTPAGRRPACAADGSPTCTGAPCALPDRPAGHHRRRRRRTARTGHLDRQAVLLPAGRGPRRLRAVARRRSAASSRWPRRTPRSPADRERWLRLAYQARGTAIAGGSTFIQRNIVAERILGMPRELRSRSQRDELPWNPTTDYIENANVTRLARAHGARRHRRAAGALGRRHRVVLGRRRSTTSALRSARRTAECSTCSNGIEHPDWFVGADAQHRRLPACCAGATTTPTASPSSTRPRTAGSVR